MRSWTWSGQTRSSPTRQRGGTHRRWRSVEYARSHDSDLRLARRTPVRVPLASTALVLLLASSAWSQQANVNLDWNPQKNTENLVPFSAPQNSPDVRDDRTVTFRLKAPLAKDVRLVGVGHPHRAREARSRGALHEGRGRHLDPDRRPAPAGHLCLPLQCRWRADRRPEQHLRGLHGHAALQPARGARRGPRLLRRQERPARHGDAPRLSLRRHGRRARALRLHAARLRPHEDLPRALPRGRQRRAALELDLRRPGELHPRQPHRRGEGRADGDGRPQQPGRAQKPPAARGAHLQALRGGAAAARPSPGGARVLRAPRPQGPGALRAVHGRTPHDVRGLQLPGPVRLVRRAERGRRRRGEVARRVPQHPRRQSEDRLPLRRPGHGGGRGPHGRARHRPRGGLEGPRHPARVLRGRPRRPRLGHLAPPAPRALPAQPLARGRAGARGRHDRIRPRAGCRGEGPHRLPRHPLRRPAHGRPPLARAAAGPQVGGRAVGREVRARSLPGGRQGQRERGLPLPQRLDAGQVTERPHSGARLDLRRRFLLRLQLHRRSTTASTSRARASCS